MLAATQEQDVPIVREDLTCAIEVLRVVIFAQIIQADVARYQSWTIRSRSGWGSGSPGVRTASSNLRPMSQWTPTSCT